MKSLSEFLEKLTGKQGIQISDLSSAQRARLLAWSRTNNIQIDDKALKASTKTISVENIHNPSSSLISVGLDVQSVRELFPEIVADIKSNKELLKIFTLAEMSYAESQANPIKHLTGIFALKEALIKATNNRVNDLTDIEIKRDENGLPRFEDYSLSLTYSGDLAAAFAIRQLSYVEPKPSKDFSVKIEHIQRTLDTQANSLERYRRNFMILALIGILLTGLVFSLEFGMIKI